MKDSKIIDGKKFTLFNQEYSKRNAEGLAREIRKQGNLARITSYWGTVPTVRGRRGNRKTKIYVVWEGSAAHK